MPGALDQLLAQAEGQDAQEAGRQRVVAGDDPAQVAAAQGEHPSAGRAGDDVAHPGVRGEHRDLAHDRAGLLEARHPAAVADFQAARQQHVDGARDVALDDERIRGLAGENVIPGQQGTHLVAGQIFQDRAQTSVRVAEPSAHLAPVGLGTLLLLALDAEVFGDPLQNLLEMLRRPGPPTQVS